MAGRTARHLEQDFEELYDRTYDRVWSFVMRRIASEHEARDVVADTYLHVWRRMRDVPDDPVLADAWVFGTARRAIANHRRGEARRIRLVGRLPSAQPVDADFDVGGDEAVVRALRNLAPKHREVLELALWDELTHAQIARVLGCSENAVAIRLHRARAALRRRYDAGLAGSAS